MKFVMKLFSNIPETFCMCRLVDVLYIEVENCFFFMRYKLVKIELGNNMRGLPSSNSRRLFNNIANFLFETHKQEIRMTVGKKRVGYFFYLYPIKYLKK